MAEKIVKSTCDLCLGSCGVQITVRDGKAVEIQGDPADPFKGHLCRTGEASLEYLYSPERLTHPLKRAGERGEGKWQKVSWDEALSFTADKLKQLKEESGPESVAVINGSAKGYKDVHLRRFANAFGTPNYANADYVCVIPRFLAQELTMGFVPRNDLSYPPAAVLIWASNKDQSYPFPPGIAWLRAAERGSKIAVINPKRIEIARKAEIFLQPRPGSDLALALAMINVIINENLYDKEFVDNWTVGFDKLKNHVQQYSPEKVAELTWIAADKIRQVARFIATNKPSTICQGDGTDHNLNSFQMGRAFAILMALTGSIGVPGGIIEGGETGTLRKSKGATSSIGFYGFTSDVLELRDNVSIEKWNNRVGADLGLISDYLYVVPQAITKAILEKKPYPIRAVYIQATNPLSCWPNIKEAFRALSNVEFLVVTDLFMTPTAALADVVFPAASYLEYDAISYPPEAPRARMQWKVAQIGECRSDHWILNEMAKRLGQKHFETEDGFWGAILEPAGLTYEEFKQIGQIVSTKEYRMYQRRGFETPSGKVELYSKHLEEEGLDPLPVFYELPESPFGSPELMKEYPLIFTSGKIEFFRDSSGRQLPMLRNVHPDPLVTIHPETAGKLGIKDGDWAYIETKRGRIKNKASLSTDVDPRVVYLEHGWWYPEKGIKELYGWADANANVLTNDEPPNNREMGSVHLKGVPVKVYKA